MSVFIYQWDDATESCLENAWSFIEGNSESIGAQLKLKLLADHGRGIALIEEEIAEGGPYEDHWNFIKSKVPSVETAIESFYKLVGVSLASSGPEGHSYVGFEFQSAWDKDHGLQILMHKTKVLCAGSMTELIDASKDIEAAVRATQAYELDPVDHKI